MPTDVAGRRLLAWAWRQVKKDDDEKPFVTESELDAATRKTLEDVAAPPACGPLLADFDEHFGDVNTGQFNEKLVQLVLLPPGDRNDVLGSWAKSHQLQILSPPDREALVSGASMPLNETSADLLIIPQLERWFLRHEDGLFAVRQVLDLIDSANCKFVIGCNTWAWDFLCKATQANLVLPAGKTFQPFGAKELREWFCSLEESGDAKWQFRLASNGDDLFVENSATDHFFASLAADSLGIPWVAWHRWRRSLRSQHSRVRGGELKPDSNEGNTLFVSPIPTFNLPPNQLEHATLLLHALLVHGSLTLQELRRVVPIVGDVRVISALTTAGFIRRSETDLQVVPTAYPEIRRELINAGFPYPKL